MLGRAGEQVGRTGPGSRQELWAEASGGCLLKCWTWVAQGPALIPILTAQVTRGVRVCGCIPSALCCPSLRPSVTITVPLTVTASCEKRIKPSCLCSVDLASVCHSCAQGSPCPSRAKLWSIIPGLRTESSLTPSCMWGLEPRVPEPSNPATWKTVSWVLAFLV